MSEQTTGQGVDVGQTWSEMLMRLAAAFPQWVIERMDSKGEPYPFVVKAIPVVIVLLSIASIETIRTRVEFHHSAWQTPAVAAGVAILVPLATLAAALIRKRSWAILFWVVSFVVASISGSIQYGVYVVKAPSFMQTVEAIAFGFGIPFAEVLFAIMEAVMIRQWLDDKAATEHDMEEAKRTVEQQAQAEQRAIDEAAKLAEQERKDQIRRDLDEQSERHRKEKEFEAKQLQEQREFELKLKLQEAEVLAKIERERVKVEAKIATAKTAKQMATQLATSQSNKPATQSTGYDDQMAMLTIYQSEPSLSDEKMAARIGKSKKTVQDLLADLATKEVVHIEKSGRGKSVAVNGKFPAFQAGKI